MKRAKIFTIIAAATVVSASLYTSPVFAASTAKLELASVATGATSNTMGATFKVTNTGSADINLSDVKVRYYFTKDSNAGQEFHCYDAAVATPSYKSLTSYVSGKFVSMDAPVDGADTYLEVSFSSNAGTLAPGATVNIQSAVNNKDWSSFTQSNDYSFNDASKTVVLVGDSVISGKVPASTGTTTPSQPATPSQPTTPGGSTVSAGTAQVTASVTNGTSANSVTPTFTVKNTGSAALDLKTVTLNYYYTADGTQAQTFNCYYAGTVDGSYKGLTSNVVGKIIAYSPKTVDADSVVQVTFNGGTLDAGQTMTVQASVNKSDWSNYTQSAESDYSYNNAQHVTVYVGDPATTTPVWGTPPVTIKSATLSPTAGTIDLANPAAVKTTITVNEAEGFNGITGLTKDVDYTVNGNEVTINPSYAQKVGKGTYPLTFDMVKGTDPVYTLTVSDTRKAPAFTEVGTGTYQKDAPAAINVGINFNGNTLSGVYNGSTALVAGTDYTVTSTGITLTDSYLKTLPIGTTNITLKFSYGTLTYTVTVVGHQLQINSPDASVKAGETVTVPVSFKGVTADDINSANLTLKYDPAIFEGATLTAGDICVNPDVSLYSEVDATTGTIKILYADPGTGEDVITKDGTFVNVALKAKSTAAAGPTKLSVAKADVADNNMSLYKVANNVGTITVVGVPIIDPLNTTFSLIDKADVKLQAQFNGTTLKSVTNSGVELKAGTDYTVTSTGVTISASYLSQFPKDTTQSLVFTFSDGTTITVTVGIKKPDVFVMDIKDAVGKPGETVTIPVDLSGLNANGINSANVTLKYDTNLFENATVVAGDICVNPDVSLYSEIDSTTGAIKLLYADPGTGEDVITKEGTFVKVSLKIKDTATAPSTSQLTVSKSDIADNAFTLYNVTKSVGKIAIEKAPLKPFLEKTDASFNLSAQEDIADGITYNNTTLKSITNAGVELKAGTDYTVTSTGVTIAKSYLAQFASGTTQNLDFTFSDGTVRTLKVVVGDVKQFVMNIKDVSGVAGDTVTIPVDLSGLNANGINSANVTLKYDTNLFENVAVTAGDICVNPDVSLYSEVDEATGAIKLLYADPGTGDDVITKAGTFVNVSLKIKSTATAPATSQLTVAKADIADNALTLYNVTKNVGKITIGKGHVFTNATINPTTATVDLYKLSDLTVNVTPNDDTFVGITGLKEGTDYTVNGNVVTISKSYFAKLKVGSASLIFDMAKGVDPTLTLTVQDTTPPTPTPVKDGISAAIGTATATAGSSVVVPVTLSGDFTKGIGVLSCRVKYDPNVFEAPTAAAGSIVTRPAANFSYSVDTTNNTVFIQFINFNMTAKDNIQTAGVLTNLTFKVKATAAAGTTPLKFANTEQDGICDIDSNTLKSTFADGSVTVQ